MLRCFELVFEPLSWKYLFVHEYRLNDCVAHMKTPGSGADVLLRRRLRVDERDQFIERAEKALGERALKFLTVGFRSADRSKRCVLFPDRVRECPCELESSLRAAPRLGLKRQTVQSVRCVIHCAVGQTARRRG